MARKSSSRVRKGEAIGPSQRQLRVGELIRHRLAELLTRGDIHDDVLSQSFVTISEVRMSPDLKIATAYVRPLGSDDGTAVVEALERNKRFIRGAAMGMLGLKFAPDIKFRFDESFDEAQRIDALLESPQVKRDLQNKN